MKPCGEILVVDDEEAMCESLSAWLREDGYAVDTATSGREALERVREKRYTVYFIDLKMPGGIDGLETMAEIRRLHPGAPVLMITAYATVDTAVAAMKLGAQEYIVKPCNPNEISMLVSRIIRENRILRHKLGGRYGFQDIVSRNARMAETVALAREVAGLPSTVLIRGESGTGKELVARAIHNSGERAARPFIGVSCAALAETLLESELFGHEKGAFTGAATQKKGKFELADGGTIFLDDIGDISPKLQVDLLRVLQERSFYRVGGSQEIHVDARVIAATHVNLEDAVEKGKFRDDLLYRLKVIEIVLPPLRNRREDIPLLAQHFVERFAHELGKNVQALSEEALGRLLDYDWPGNVRELENAIERALATARNPVLTAQDFAFLARTLEARKNWTPPANLTLQEVEKEVIAAALRRNQGNIKETAAVLGIDRSTLYEKLKRYAIPR